MLRLSLHRTWKILKLHLRRKKNIVKYKYFTVDYENKSLYFIPPKVNEHIIFVNYNAGYTKESFPADLKEAIIKLFLLKQKTLNKLTNNEAEETKETLPAEIKDSINHYTRKHLW